MALSATAAGNHLKLRCFVSFIVIRLLFATFLSFLFIFIFFLVLFCCSIDPQAP